MGVPVPSSVRAMAAVITRQAERPPYKLATNGRCGLWLRRKKTGFFRNFATNFTEILIANTPLHPMKPILSPSRFYLPLFCGVALPLLAAATAARAQNPGDQDATFATGPEASSSAYALALQSNGQVLVGGAFATFRGVARNGIARLDPNGSLDGFNPGLALSAVNGQSGPPTVKALALQPDGQVLATGGVHRARPTR